MSMNIDDIKEMLGEDEEILFNKRQSIFVNDEMSGNVLREIKDVDIYISNLANIYIYSDKSNFCHYYKQGEKVRRFVIDNNEDKVIIHVKNTKFKPKKKSFIFVFADVTMDIEISKDEFEGLKSKQHVLMFKDKNEIEKEKDSEAEEDVLLEAEGLYKLYGDNKEEFAALKGVSLRIYEGDFVCIMGPSGSGKSTLINLLSTIDEPSRGTVKFKGKNLAAMYEFQLGRFRYENLGFIFQDFNLLNNLTVKENIAVPLVLASKPRNEIEEKIKNIAEKLGIAELLDKYPSECSGGQDQRVACARALITNPKIIVADEPTGNLDTKNSHDLLKIIQKLNEDGTTVVMVTHDSMIASYSKKLLFIRDGKIDNVLEKGCLSQKDYFYKIVDITSKDSQSLLDM